MERFMDDGQAIRRMKLGDIGGLESIVSRYQVKALRTAFLITHDEPMAEDVVQDVFVRVFQRIRGFDEIRAFEPYLMRSVVNAALNTLASPANRREAPGECDEEAWENLLLEAASVEDQVEFTQCKQEILAALRRLSPRQRAAVVQRYYLDLSEKDMAQALDAAPGTVKWLLNAARTRLRALLGTGRGLE
jgi:RNA polymerase sigma-70 factor, ECF subfamily